MWMLIDGIAYGKSTKTCLLYESTKSLRKTGDYPLGCSRLQDSPFNSLITQVSICCSPDRSVLLSFWLAVFWGIEIWGKQGGENGTMSLHHVTTDWRVQLCKETWVFLNWPVSSQTPVCVWCVWLWTVCTLVRRGSLQQPRLGGVALFFEI